MTADQIIENNDRMFRELFGIDVGLHDLAARVAGARGMVAALCLAQNLNMHENGETELLRIWEKMEQIRTKQSRKPQHSPLPE